KRRPHSRSALIRTCWLLIADYIGSMFRPKAATLRSLTNTIANCRKSSKDCSPRMRTRLLSTTALIEFIGRCRMLAGNPFSESLCPPTSSYDVSTEAFLQRIETLPGADVSDQPDSFHG